MENAMLPLQGIPKDSTMGGDLTEPPVGESSSQAVTPARHALYYLINMDVENAKAFQITQYVAVLQLIAFTWLYFLDPAIGEMSFWFVIYFCLVGGGMWFVWSRPRFQLKSAIGISALLPLFFPASTTLLWPIGLMLGFVYMLQIFERKMTAMRQNIADHLPSPGLFRRLDYYLTTSLKCIGACILLGYVACLLLVVDDDSSSYTISDRLIAFATVTLSFGTLMFLLVITLIADRPKSRTDARALMLQPRRYIFTDDPLMEPLLIV